MLSLPWLEDASLVPSICDVALADLSGDGIEEIECSPPILERSETKALFPKKEVFESHENGAPSPPSAACSAKDLKLALGEISQSNIARSPSIEASNLVEEVDQVDVISNYAYTCECRSGEISESSEALFQKTTRIAQEFELSEESDSESAEHRTSRESARAMLKRDLDEMQRDLTNLGFKTKVGFSKVTIAASLRYEGNSEREVDADEQQERPAKKMRTECS